jgi:low affinity Fe/Cu permease
MKKIYRHIERLFEAVALKAIAILGNSITFIIALITVIFWLFNRSLLSRDFHSLVGDAILCVTFLSLFIIQKSFNRFSASLHLKVNELVSSHEPARDEVIRIGNRTEHEIVEFLKGNVRLGRKNGHPRFVKLTFMQFLLIRLRRIVGLKDRPKNK